MCLCSVAQSCLTLCDPMAVAQQAPPSMAFSRQEYWSRLPFPTQGDLLNLGIEPKPLASLASTGRFVPSGKPMLQCKINFKKYIVTATTTRILSTQPTARETEAQGVRVMGTQKLD